MTTSAWKRAPFVVAVRSYPCRPRMAARISARETGRAPEGRAGVAARAGRMASAARLNTLPV